jgi:hypothetical protein
MGGDGGRESGRVDACWSAQSTKMEVELLMEDSLFSGEITLGTGPRYSSTQYREDNLLISYV